MLPFLLLWMMTQAVRVGDQPIITPASSPTIGDNINGPSLIRVPAWVQHPLGRYYLYFAHHEGKYIRLAYADRLTGPWKIHEPGTLRLENVKTCFDHIASPDVHVDEAAKQIRMYFHCPTRQPNQPLNTGEGKGVDITIQNSLVATSRDGVDFTPQEKVLGGPYFRVFQWRGQYYAIAWGGHLFRSRDGMSPFEAGPQLFPNEKRGMRHNAPLLRGDTLRLYFSRISDEPERILLSEIKLTSDWRKWTPSEPQTVLEPERGYEGGNLPLAESKIGLAPTPVRQLRDPAIFEENGHVYLLYTVAGERGIGLAEIK